ncbi:MAG: universal stress protein [Planctomycetales bacterium]|nr:universal stress protein [Planctomycetales bacterium]
MKANHIVMATDFSDYAQAALEYATALARDTGATLHILHVIEDPPLSADRGFGGFQAEAEMEATEQEMLEKVLPTDAGVPYVHKLLHGRPSRCIVEYADSAHADMIVLGTHGHKGLLRALLGSVAEEVVRRSACPVLTIKQPAKELA